MKKSRINYFFVAVLLILVTLVSCDIRRKLKEEEQEKIANYLASNPDLAFQQKPSGLYYLDVVVGGGPQAETNDSAMVFYNMKSLDGKLFETNVGSTDTLRVLVNGGKLDVKGFEEGISYMREGGQALLLVPSKLAFGEEGKSVVGGYTPLLFDCYLVRLKKHSAR